MEIVKWGNFDFILIHNKIIMKKLNSFPCTCLYVCRLSLRDSENKMMASAMQRAVAGLGGGA